MKSPRNKQFEYDCEQRLKHLHLKIIAAAGSDLSPIEQVTRGYQYCDELLDHIASGLLIQPFSTQEQRLQFYKDILTQAIALKVFCRERYYIQVNRPAAADSDGVKRYCDLQLNQLEMFQNKYGFFNGYYRSGMSNLDQLYYLPGQNMQFILMSEVELPSSLVLGAGCYLFARFRASELLTEFLFRFHQQALFEIKEAAKPVTRRENIVQTMLNLSVDQIGLGARAALDSTLISGKSFQQVCEDLAPRIATKGRTNISAASIRSNAYTGEDIDKHTLIRYLEKMIRFIREY